MAEKQLETGVDIELENPADFTSPEVLYQDLIKSIRKYHPSDDISQIEKHTESPERPIRTRSGSRVNLILFTLFVLPLFWRIWSWIKKPSLPEFFMMW